MIWDFSKFLLKIHNNNSAYKKMYEIKLIIVIVALVKLHLNNKWRHFYDDNFIIFLSLLCSIGGVCLFMFWFIAFICVRRTHIRVVLRRKWKLLYGVKRDFLYVTMWNDFSVKKVKFSFICCHLLFFLN